jgi:hypothetical protein
VGQVDDWIGYASSFGVGAEFEGACAYANSYLTLRTFLVGNDLSITDATIVAYLAGTFMFYPNAHCEMVFAYNLGCQYVVEVFEKYRKSRQKGR